MEVKIRLRHEGYSEDRIEALFKRHGLEVALKTTLAKYPGGVHWHLKKPGEKGTLEATLWNNELFLQVRRNRDGEWIMSALHEISDFLK